VERRIAEKATGTALTFLGQTWGMGSPRFSAEQIANWTRKITKAGGAITWDTPIQKNGLIAEPFLKQLGELRKAQGNTQQF
jgi:hypothetical protein